MIKICTWFILLFTAVLVKAQDLQKNKISSSFNNLPGSDLNMFYNTLADNTKYPPKTLERGITALVTVTFKINKQRQIDDIKVIASADTSFNTQLKMGLSKSTISPLMKTGCTYAIRVGFLPDEYYEPNWWRRKYRQLPTYSEAISNTLGTSVIMLSDILVINYNRKQLNGN